jgi:hypothetical protein
MVGAPFKPGFWLEWDSAALDWQFSLLQQIPRSMIIYALYSQRSRSVESPLKPKTGLIGAPIICYR